MSGFLLFAKDERNLLSFKSKQSLEGYVEPPEVLDDLYIVFDEEGNIYDVSLNDQGRPQVGSFQSSEPQLLTEYLRSFLALIRPQHREFFDTLRLSELVEQLKSERACLRR